MNKGSKVMDVLEVVFIIALSIVSFLFGAHLILSRIAEIAGGG